VGGNLDVSVQLGSDVWNGFGSFSYDAATVLRIDPTTGAADVFAHGFRNHYDLAFNGDGELFTYDSDMEWDIGAPWYRAPRVLHLVEGGDFGWR
jgi:glucose/arabinose dehydrogenase